MPHFFWAFSTAIGPLAVGPLRLLRRLIPCLWKLQYFFMVIFQSTNLAEDDLPRDFPMRLLPPTLSQPIRIDHFSFGDDVKRWFNFVSPWWQNFSSMAPSSSCRLMMDVGGSYLQPTVLVWWNIAHQFGKTSPHWKGHLPQCRSCQKIGTPE